MTRTRRLAAQASMIVCVIAFMAVGGAAGAWVGDRALGLTDSSPREVVVSRRDEFPFFGIIAILAAFGGAFIALSSWPLLARAAGLSEDEIRVVMRRRPSAPDA